MIRPAIIAVLLASPAAAQDRISITLGSHHTDTSYQWEEVNPGLFLTWERGLDYSVGAFRNSFGGPSVAAVAALPVARWQDGQAAIFGGLAYYPGHGEEFLARVGDVVPMGGIQVRHGNVFMQAMPGKFEPLEMIFAVGLTFNLGNRK
jgi:hypothetical protein